MDDPSQYQQVSSNQMSVEAFTTETALKYRLDTAPLKYEVQMFLEGKTEMLRRDDDGRLITIQEDKGRCLANDIGIQRIMAKLAFILNSQNVQGNLTMEKYEIFMERTRRSLAKHVFVNMYDYEIDEKEFDFIVDNIIDAIELFVSRTINDQERKSYVGWMVHNEQSQAGTTKKSGIWDRLTGKS